MNTYTLKKLHEKANGLLEMLEEADSRIQCQEEYARNKQWQYLFPTLVRKAEDRIVILEAAKVRILRWYKQVITEINNRLEA